MTGLHAFGEREARRIAMVDQIVLGQVDGGDFGNSDNPPELGPVVVRMADDETEVATQLDRDNNEMHDIDVQIVERIAWPIPGRGWCVQDGVGGSGSSGKSCSVYLRTPDMIHTSTETDILTFRNWGFSHWCCCEREEMKLVEQPVTGGKASWTGGIGVVTYVDARDAWVYEIPGEDIVVTADKGTVIAYSGGATPNRSGELVVTLTAADGWNPVVTLEAAIS